MNSFYIHRFRHCLKSPCLIGALLFFGVLFQMRGETIDGMQVIQDGENTTHTFPNPIKKILLQSQRNKKIAAALAFPFPFGVVGLHRVYLKTSPHVPIVYAATAGGVFGILPLIDCLILISKKDISDCENNPRVIMWINHSLKKIQ